MARLRSGERQQYERWLIRLIDSQPYGVSESELADLLGWQRRTVNNYLRRLEQSGFIYRESQLWFAERRGTMIILPGMEHYTKTFMALDYEPLTVTAHLVHNSQVVAYEPPPYLDGLLAWAVLQIVTAGQGVPQNTPQPYWIPLPLRCLWVSPEGLPLWAASVFQPQADTLKDVTYIHKRNPPGEFSQSARWNPKAGRWMERRRPLPTTGCGVWLAHCIGNREWIERLLVQNVGFLGKNRGIGFGEIVDWTVSPSSLSNPLVQGGQLMHAIPSAWPDHPTISTPTHRVGWTPPLWKRSLFSEGWPVATPIATTDWYVEATSSNVH